MKALIAVISCHTKPELRDAIRQTWAPLVPAGTDCRFFLGRADKPYLPQADEVLLDCNDSYQGLIEKVREVSRWAYANGYDFFLKCDDDTVLRPAALMASDFNQYDFVGSDNGDMPRDTCRGCGKAQCRQKTGEYITPWGFCYWVSKRGMTLLNDAELPPHSANDECWVAHVLGENGVLMHHDDRYIIHSGHNPNETSEVPEPRVQAAAGMQYAYKEEVTERIEPRSGRTGRVVKITKKVLVQIPMTTPAPSGHDVSPREEYFKNGFLIRSKFTDVQATPETFAYCIHLGWNGHHCTPIEKIVEEFKKVFANPAIVWFDRRVFGAGTWRHRLP